MPSDTQGPALTLRLARDAHDLHAAQRLRYRVFVQELGASGPLVDHAEGLERDEVDPFCDHLLLIDPARDPDSLDHVVGAYRLLTEAGAARAGRFYSEAEYDIAPLRASGRRLLELGRSCIERAYRGSGALHLLWTGLADYALAHRVQVLFGTASFHGTDPAPIADALSYLHHFHLAPDALRATVLPGQAQDMALRDAATIDRRAALQAIPPLIKSYLRLGGYVGQGAFVDHAFNTIDVLLILDATRISPRQLELLTRSGGPLR